MLLRDMNGLYGSHAQRSRRYGLVFCGCASVLAVASACSTYGGVRKQVAANPQQRPPVLIERHFVTKDRDRSVVEYNVKSCREFPVLFLWTYPICVERMYSGEGLSGSGPTEMTCRHYSHSLRFYDVRLFDLPILNVRELRPGAMLSFTVDYHYPEPSFDVEFAVADKFGEHDLETILGFDSINTYADYYEWIIKRTDVISLSLQQ